MKHWLEAHPVALSPGHSMEAWRISTGMKKAFLSALSRQSSLNAHHTLEIRLPDDYATTHPKNFSISGSMRVSGIPLDRVIDPSEPSITPITGYIAEKVKNLLVKNLFVLLSRDNFVIHENLQISKTLISANYTCNLVIELRLAFHSNAKPRLTLISEHMELQGSWSDMRTESTSLEELLPYICERHDDGLCPLEVVSYLPAPTTFEIERTLLGIANVMHRNPQDWEPTPICHGDYIIVVKSPTDFKVRRYITVEPRYEDSP